MRRRKVAQTELSVARLSSSAKLNACIYLIFRNFISYCEKKTTAFFEFLYEVLPPAKCYVVPKFRNQILVQERSFKIIPCNGIIVFLSSLFIFIQIWYCFQSHCQYYIPPCHKCVVSGAVIENFASLPCVRFSLSSPVCLTRGEVMHLLDQRVLMFKSLQVWVLLGDEGWGLYHKAGLLSKTQNRSFYLVQDFASCS